MPLSVLLFPEAQSLLMRIYLTRYSIRQNPVYTVRLRHSGYPLACSAAGPEELPWFGDSAREIMIEKEQTKAGGKRTSPCTFSLQ